MVSDAAYNKAYYEANKDKWQKYNQNNKTECRFCRKVYATKNFQEHCRTKKHLLNCVLFAQLGDIRKKIHKRILEDLELV